MHNSPISASPYEVLGVTAGADESALRRAYRRALRESHPDTGGDPTQFQAVQDAWNKVGTPTARAAYDRGDHGGANGQTHTSWAPAAPRSRPDSRPTARSYGHPGGYSRERYIVLMREFAGRGVNLPDPYDPALVRSAPRDIRHLLANALIEEATARTLSHLGIGFTLWHDVAIPPPTPGAEPKLDHVVLGPSGLFSVQSEDWGGPVRTRRGELIGEAVGADKPMHALAARTKSLARAAKVKFTGQIIVVPDAALEESLLVLGSTRGAVTAVVAQSRLAGVMRDGLPGATRIGGTEIFEVRTRLQAKVQLIE